VRRPPSESSYHIYVYERELFLVMLIGTLLFAEEARMLFISRLRLYPSYDFRLIIELQVKNQVEETFFPIRVTRCSADSLY